MGFPQKSRTFFCGIRLLPPLAVMMATALGRLSDASNDVLDVFIGYNSLFWITCNDSMPSQLLQKSDPAGLDSIGIKQPDQLIGNTARAISVYQPVHGG